VTATRRRTLLLAAAPVLALLLAAYAAWWQVLAERWRTGVERWTGAQAKSGWTISTGAVSVGGFPGRVRLVLPAPKAADADGDFWEGPPLAIIVSPFAPLDPRIEAPGTHLLALAGREPAALAAGTLDGSVVVAHGAPDSLELSGTSLAAAGVAAASARIELRRLPPDAAQPNLGSLGINLEIGQLALPEGLSLPLDRTVSLAHLAARLTGVLSPEGAMPSPKAWRDAGGVLDIESLTLDWPPLVAAGNATLALDRAMQPELAGSFTLRGGAAAIDRMGEAGTIKPAAAVVAKLALGLASKKAADGTKEATLAVTIQNRILSVGPVPLLQLPEVKW